LEIGHEVEEGVTELGEVWAVVDGGIILEEFMPLVVVLELGPEENEPYGVLEVAGVVIELEEVVVGGRGVELEEFGGGAEEDEPDIRLEVVDVVTELEKEEFGGTA
jgi:hypothetical protein